MMNSQWVVQRNLNESYFSELKDACERLGIPFVGIDVIPFSDELPEFDRTQRTIFYGSTTFNKLAFDDSGLNEGVFFNPATFSIERYLHEWGEYMLNHGAQVTTFDRLMREDYDPERLLFIRPDDDGKSFAGEVLKFADCREWFERLKVAESLGLSGDTRIIVGEPFHIGKGYRNNFKLDKRRGCPDAVVAFAEARCLQFTPHDVFVMDICETGGDLYIVDPAGRVSFGNGICCM